MREEAAEVDPGWFVDPLGRFDGRFFDGSAWTARVSDQGVLRDDPDWPAEPAQHQHSNAVIQADDLVPRGPSELDNVSVRASRLGQMSSRRKMTAARGDVSASSLLPILVNAEDVVAGELEAIAESVRSITVQPRIAGVSAIPMRIAVVAAVPGEGVTTISSVFSSVLSSDFGIETCRVDLSWASTRKAGVKEVLLGEADLDEVLEWHGGTATLHAGGVNPSERHRLARSEELDKLIAVLSSRFQYVVLDLPAVLGSSEALAMMRLVDGYLLVVRHGVTTLRQVQSATDQLSDFESLGSVLNQVRISTPRPLLSWLRP